MPSLKVFVDAERSVTDADLETFNRVVIEGLDAHGEHAVVAAIPARVNLSGCYVELTCRHKPNRTPAMLERLAAALDTTARDVFGIDRPVRVRIIMVDEQLLGAAN